MNWRKRKVLVTGAGGFIGSHLTERLVNLGANVKAFIRYNSRDDEGMLEALPFDIRRKIKVVAGDLKDPDCVCNAVKGMEIVFHLGALIAVPYSYVYPRHTIETNILGTLNVLLAARDEKVKRAVHTSTSEVYGTALYIPIDEKHPLQAQSPYSASKIGADKLAESFYLTYDLPVTIIRPFNTYGPRQSARSVIPTIIIQALNSNEIHLGSLEPTRDFTYVDDVVDAFIKIADSPIFLGEVINIGSNFEISIENLVKKISSLLGKELKVICDLERLRPKRSEVYRLCADNTKAKKLLNWEPKVKLEEGLKRTLDYISQNIERYKLKKYII